MTQKEFVRKVTNGKKDLLQEFATLLKKKRIPFCIIGGLAVNAYAEPVVSLNLDVVVMADRLPGLLDRLDHKYQCKKYRDRIYFSSPFSDLRIQIQTDPRYQAFIRRAHSKNVLGYRFPVAAIDDALKGKIWAAQDGTRRPSKRQEDLADILRLIETKKNLISLVPYSLRRKLAV